MKKSIFICMLAYLAFFNLGTNNLLAAHADAEQESSKQQSFKPIECTMAFAYLAAASPVLLSSALAGVALGCTIIVEWILPGSKIVEIAYGPVGRKVASVAPKKIRPQEYLALTFFIGSSHVLLTPAIRPLFHTLSCLLCAYGSCMQDTSALSSKKTDDMLDKFKSGDHTLDKFNSGIVATAVLFFLSDSVASFEYPSLDEFRNGFCRHEMIAPCARALRSATEIINLTRPGGEYEKMGAFFRALSDSARICGSLFSGDFLSGVSASTMLGKELATLIEPELFVDNQEIGFMAEAIYQVPFFGDLCFGSSVYKNCTIFVMRIFSACHYLRDKYGAIFDPSFFSSFYSLCCIINSAVQTYESCNVCYEIYVLNTPSRLNSIIASLIQDFDLQHTLSQELKDQRDYENCWAFALSRLAESQICCQDPQDKNCGKAISTLFIGKGQMNMVFGKNGKKKPKDIYEREQIEGLFSAGVCLEQNVPSPTRDDERRINDNLLSALIKYGAKLADCDIPIEERTVYDPSNGHRFILVPELYKVLLNLLGSDNSGLTDLHKLVAALQEHDPSVFNHLERSLGKDSCKDNRISLQAAKVFSSSYPSGLPDIKEIAKKIDSSAKEGHVVYLGIDIGYFRKGKISDMSHAIIIDAVRHDSETCFAHVVNSWGTDPELSGWLPLPPILQSTRNISCLSTSE